MSNPRVTLKSPSWQLASAREKVGLAIALSEGDFSQKEIGAMTSKYSPKQRRPAAAYILDQRKLLAFRERAGLSLAVVEELSRIPKSTIHDYEHGRIVPQLHQFKKLCEVYQLDVFEIMELLRLNFMERRDLKSFRTACRDEGVTPEQALRDFMLVYAYHPD